MRSFIVSGFLLFAIVPAAIPCARLEGPLPHEIDRASLDKRMPGRPSGEVVDVFRHGITLTPGCAESVAKIKVTRARDAGTRRGALGFKWRVVGGSAIPTRFRPVPPHGWRMHEGNIEIAWDDEEGDQCNTRPVSFDVVLIAVDGAGNESRPSRPIRIAHPGNEVSCD